MRRLMLIDLQNLFYRGFHVHPHLSWNGIPTGGAYGVVSQLATLAISYQPTQVAFCDDSKPYARSMYYSGYKSGRAERTTAEQEKIGINFDIVYEFIETVGVPLVRMKYAEADDLMAALAANHHDEFDEVLIVSNDSDLLQILDMPRIRILRGVGKKRKVWGLREFKIAYPDLRCARDWLLINGLTGGHNGLPGLAGIGEKRAIQWYKESVVQGKTEGRLQERVRAADFVLTSAYFMATLPFPGIGNWNKLRLEQCARQRYSLSDVTRMLARYGIRMSGQMIRGFERF